MNIYLSFFQKQSRGRLCLLCYVRSVVYRSLIVSCDCCCLDEIIYSLLSLSFFLSFFLSSPPPPFLSVKKTTTKSEPEEKPKAKQPEAKQPETKSNDNNKVSFSLSRLYHTTHTNSYQLVSSRCPSLICVCVHSLPMAIRPWRTVWSSKTSSKAKAQSQLQESRSPSAMSVDSPTERCSTDPTR